MAMTTRKRGRQDQEESEFPCIKCGREVRPRQQGLECDICSRWQHRVRRTGVNLEEYRRAMRHGIEWNCEECLANQSLPANEMTRLSGFDEGVFSFRSDLDDHMESPVHESTRMSLLTDESAAPNQHDEMPSALEEPSINEELLEEQRPALDEEVQEEPSIDEELLEEQRPALDEEVFKYINNTWIVNASHPVKAWSAYGRAVRTNNDCEGWHHRLNGKTGGKALGVYQLMALLHRESAVVDITVRLVNLRKMTRRQKRKAATAHGRVFRLWAEYEDGAKTAEELLRACFHIHGNVRGQ